jgi:probable HAF family extracellular repeat protein
MKKTLILLVSICGLSLLVGCGSGGRTSPATHFSVVPASNAATAGSAFNITVTALNASNSVATGYSGTVHFTSSDSQATLPANSTLMNGVGTFPVTLKTAGAQTVTATDIATAISGISGSINVSGGSATHFSVTAPTSAAAGGTFNFAVTALDALNNVATNYTGMVHFTSTDPQAVLPGNSTLTSEPGTFPATLKTVGAETLTATDTVKPSITGTSNSINVASSGVLQITSGTPPNGTLGVAYDTRLGDVHCNMGSPGCRCIPLGLVFYCFKRENISSFPLTASGGLAPYSWSWTPAANSSLPPGLTVSNALISGTPTLAGSYNVVVTVNDSASAHATAAYAITINATSDSKSVDALAPGFPHEHHHYKLIDLGTFGGPESYINGFEYSTFSSVQDLNNAGALTGWADTSKLDPYGPSFCFNGGCHVSHAFQWENGAKSDLGTLQGGQSSATSWISANGLIAGTSQNGETDPLDPGFPEDQAVIWEGGKIVSLGNLPEGNYESGAQSVNSRGQVVGWALNTVSDPSSMALWSTLYNFYEPIYPYQMRAFLWQDGSMQDLGTLGTGSDAFAMAINEQGQVIGISYTSSTPNEVMTPCSNGSPIPTQDPFFWERETGMLDLGTLGGTCGFSSWINKFGQVVGNSDLAGDQAQHAFLWTRARGMRDLGTLGGSNSEASMINDSGEVVGGSQLKGDTQYDAFLWDGKMHDLGTLGGSNCSYAFSINSQRQVVGNSGPDCGSAFLWEDGGPMVDLSTLVSPMPGFTSLGVININERGEIASFAMNAEGYGRAVLLIPCDENHPDVAGCDYSLVDPSITAQENEAQTSALATSQGNLSLTKIMLGYRSLVGSQHPRFPKAPAQ